MKTSALIAFFLTAVAAFAGHEVPISSTTTLSLVPATSCRLASNGASIYAVFDRFPHPFGALVSANGDIDLSTTVPLPGVIADDVTSSGVAFFALTTSVEPRGLFVTRINVDGSLGTQVLIPVTARIYPRIVASGSRVFVTYEDSASAAIHVLILDRDLNVVVDDVTISGPTYYENAHASVLLADTLFVVWLNSDRGASGARVNSYGAVSALDLSIPHVASVPILSTSGNDALLVFSPASGEISAVALSLDGSVQHLTTVEAPYVTDVAWDGREYKIAFFVPSDDGCTGGKILLGSLTGEKETISDQAGAGASLVRTNDGLFAAWKEKDCGDPERGALFGRLVSDPPGPIAGLSYGIADQLEPSIAVGSANTVAVWREGKRVWISHPDEPAQRLDPLERSQSSPQIASDGESFLSVWVEDSKRVVARFVTPEVNLGDRFTIVDQERVDNVTVTWSGKAYTVAWNGSGAAIATIDLDENVTPLLALSDTVAGSIGLSRNVIAYVEQHGNDWVVTARSSTGPPFAIATVTAIPSIGNAGLLSAWSPRVACADESCLLTWTKRNGPFRGTEAWTAVVTLGGTIASRPVVIGGRSDWTNDVIAIPVFDGKSFKILQNAGFAIVEDDFTAGSLSRNRWVLYGKFAAMAATADNDEPTIVYSRALAPDTASRGFVQQLDGRPWGRRATRR